MKNMKEKVLKYSIWYFVVAIIFATIISVIGISIISSNTQPTTEKDYRPKHCIDNKCIDKTVFANLPEYPEDFYNKWVLVYLGRISNLDIIEEEYWKQPEFYANNFDEQGKEYYTTKQMKFSAGSGPYPGDVMIENITQGETVKATTFWHSSWAISRYQAFTLTPDFPTKMTIRMTDISINQIQSVSECIRIEYEPNTIILEPTYPIFMPNWTVKITAYITVNCPVGQYGLQLLPSDPDPKTLEKLEFEYGTKLSSMRVGGAWQIFLKVEH